MSDFLVEYPLEPVTVGIYGPDLLLKRPTSSFRLGLVIPTPYYSDYLFNLEKHSNINCRQYRLFIRWIRSRVLLGITSINRYLIEWIIGEWLKAGLMTRLEKTCGLVLVNTIQLSKDRVVTMSGDEIHGNVNVYYARRHGKDLFVQYPQQIFRSREGEEIEKFQLVIMIWLTNSTFHSSISNLMLNDLNLYLFNSPMPPWVSLDRKTVPEVLVGSVVTTGLDRLEKSTRRRRYRVFQAVHGQLESSSNAIGPAFVL